MVTQKFLELLFLVRIKVVLLDSVVQLVEHNTLN